MWTLRNKQAGFITRTVLLIVLATVATALISTAGLEAKPKVMRPADSEFGMGPRASINGRYMATLEPVEPLRKRATQTVRVRITDAAGNAINGAQITIDGGMPQHGHGLPTRPRMTQSLGDGRYEIEGVRFSMGGWWEFKVSVSAPGGSDTITFNLQL